MNLGTLTLKIIPADLDYDQLAIDTKQPIILKNNGTGLHSWSGALSTLELKRDTIIALMNKKGYVWSGILSDVNIIANGIDDFTIDFSPVIEATGVTIPSTRFRKKKEGMEIMESEEFLEESGLEIVEINTEDMVAVDNTTIVEIETKEEAKEEPKEIEPSVIVLNGISLRIKQ